MNNSFKTALLAALVILILSPVLSVAGEPTEKIRTAIDGVIEILKTESLKGEPKAKIRREKIRSAIQSRFSFEAMTRRSLGKNWKKLSKEEKVEFVAVFGTMIENSYIGKLEKYTDEEVLYEKETIKKTSAEVKTQVVTSTGTKIPINYRLSNKSGEWLVYDVVVEGVSLVSNYRSQFAQELKKESVAKLITKLKSKSENNL